ncbi:MAG: hypothetical protein K2K70_13890 [Lachnospiraceae bacterium]|nr:hypothetical protein [Lachnospiraceae bacterium]
MTDSEKLDLLLQKVSILEKDMEAMKEEQVSLRQDMREMETSFIQDMKEVKEDISSLREEIHLTLENEITPNINIIAEGHLELSRKLNECIHISSDIKAKQEILDVFINMQKTSNRLKALG